MTTLSRTIFVGLVLFGLPPTFAAAASQQADYRFPTRHAEVQNAGLVDNATDTARPVAEVIRGQAFSGRSSPPAGGGLGSFPMSSPPSGGAGAMGSRSGTLGSSDAATPTTGVGAASRTGAAESELATRPPDPIGPVDPASIPEVLRPLSHLNSDPRAHAGDPDRRAEPVPETETAKAGGATMANTLLLIIALAAGGLAAYATFAAIDYKQRWEHAILEQNDRLLGAFDPDESLAMPQSW